MHYDVIIIGAGLSGLSAGIRLSHFGYNTAIFEKHSLPGGLNGYYKRHGEIYDAGLHAMTNIATEEDRSAPLNKLLRQLRIKRNSLNLAPQVYSEIQFPSCILKFSNDIEELTNQIAEFFPNDTNGFKELCSFVKTTGYDITPIAGKSAREELQHYISAPLLIDMLLFPVMLYGSPTEHDMDFGHFCIIFNSIFLEGLARPIHGMKPLIDNLANTFTDNGGKLFLGNAVKSIHCDESKIIDITDSDGQVHTANIYISSIGLHETLAKCDNAELLPSPGEISFVESIFKLAKPISHYGIKQSLIFKNTNKVFDFKKPDIAVDNSCQLICLPGNFAGCAEIPVANTVKISMPASHELWFNYSKSEYEKTKDACTTMMMQQFASLSEEHHAEILSDIISSETFTPKTITRFTGHVNGAIYGAPEKIRSGEIGYDNLRLCGTDQGLLGIVGSMISGNVIANSAMQLI